MGSLLRAYPLSTVRMLKRRLRTLDNLTEQTGGEPKWRGVRIKYSARTISPHLAQDVIEKGWDGSVLAELRLTLKTSARLLPFRMESEWVALIFRVPSSKSADARDGILLLVVMGHNGLDRKSVV